MKVLSSIFFVTSLLFIFSCTDELPTKKEKRKTIEEILTAYQDCKSDESTNFCKTFIARSICEYNGVNDLKEGNDYIVYHKIYDKIIKDDTWKNLGMANQQEALDNAQLMANKGFPVVAVDINDKHKFTVLILQGKQLKSGKWRLNVPNCAAFFPTNYKRSFTNKTLNYAWKKPDGIQLWVRK